jgi:hypothetical protein
MRLKGILLGTTVGVISLILFWRFLAEFLTARLVPGLPAAVDIRPFISQFVSQFFGGAAIGLGIVATIILSLWFYTQYQPQTIRQMVRAVSQR